MKILISIFLVFIFATVISCSAILGRDRCTYGPSYWCANITNAKGCGAVRHCIKTVWEKQHVPEDTDSICQICLDMVKQARDQLESNETMEELKEVFEGSCDLIPINVVKKECRKLADDFIPELVEALSSQMNPQVVCSTAGLCNNAAIDKLLEEYEAQHKTFNCDKCNNIGDAIYQKFHTSSRDQVLDGFLNGCGRLSSFSDGCASIVLTYFDNIYGELSKNLKAENICHMSGVCASKFHSHASANVEIKTESNIGVIRAKDDIPCELCEQLVKHLRDILVANTTEQEFKTVLQGLCSQTKAFKDECNTIVDQYYNIIYETLVNNLDANGVCFMIGICHKGEQFATPHMPLLPSHQAGPPKRRLGENEKVLSNDEIKSMVLPIDQLMGAKSSLDLVANGEKCAICQYFLHFVQEELSDPKNEDQIKETVKKTCEKFPKSIAPSCDSFVELYGDAIIALLVQEIDPKDVCPQLKLCPRYINQDVDIFAPNTVHVEINEESKPTCPLCELVVAQARQFIDSSKSKESAKHALEKVCKHLPPKPQLQCNDFVETYYDELLEKLLSDLTPKSVCNLLKLCPGIEMSEDDIKVGVERVNYIPHVIDTNEIPDFTYEGQVMGDSGECILCTSVVGGAETRISKDMSKQQVENLLFDECSKFRPYQGICDKFVQQNVDEIVDLLAKDMAPRKICEKLSLCAIESEDELNIDEAVIINVVAIPVEAPKKLVRVPLTSNSNKISQKKVGDDPICVLCEFVMTKLETELKDKHTQEEIKQAVETICSKMPKSVSKQCTKFVDEYADLIITLIGTVPPKEICTEMGLCAPVKKHMHLVGESECTWGPTHFCGDAQVAEKCGATEYCKKKKIGMFAE